MALQIHTVKMAAGDTTVGSTPTPLDYAESPCGFFPNSATPPCRLREEALPARFRHAIHHHLHHGLHHVHAFFYHLLTIGHVATHATLAFHALHH